MKARYIAYTIICLILSGCHNDREESHFTITGEIKNVNLIGKAEYNSADVSKLFITGDIDGYGLGVRCSKGVQGYGDFGWDGAAGAFMAIDLENEITVFYVQHLRNDPGNPNRHLVYDYARDALTK